jgi:signal transduction histidine kinase
MGARIRIPLWVLLPFLAVSVVALGAVAAGAVGILQARGYLTRQADGNLAACARTASSQQFTAGPTSGPAPSGACDVELLSATGQLLTPTVPGASHGPAIPAEPSWLAAHTGRPVTVPGADGSWRVLVEQVHYQPRRILFVYGTEDDVDYVVSRPAGRHRAGLLVVMTGLAGLGRLTGRISAGYATAAGVVLVVLAVAGLAVTRAFLRPLRAGAENPARFPAVQPALSRISEQMDASRAAEAAACRSTAEMAERIAEVSLELRRSVSIVRGFAESCLQPGKPPPSADDPMLRRAADEAARIETLVAQLDPEEP